MSPVGLTIAWSWFLAGLSAGLLVHTLLDWWFPIKGYDTAADLDDGWHVVYEMPELPPKPDGCVDECPGCQAHALLEILLELGDDDAIAADAAGRLLPTATHGHVQR